MKEYPRCCENCIEFLQVSSQKELDNYCIVKSKRLEKDFTKKENKCIYFNRYNRTRK